MEPKVLKSTQVFIIAAAILLTLFVTLLCIGFLVRYEVVNDVSSLRSVAYWNDKLPKEQEIWFSNAIDELKVALNLRNNKRRAKNVIIFVATGINADVLAAARLRDASLPYHAALSWDSFSHLGLLKHKCNSTNSCVPLNRATALFGGIKTNFKLIGLDAAFPQRNCSAVFNSSHHIKSIMQLAQEINKRSGLITTGRVTAPNSAALYAHVSEADWECDASMPRRKQNEGCRDIARELMETQTGQSLNVIMGGGRQALVANVPDETKDPLDENACNSRDRRNLISVWKKQKSLDKQSFAVLKNVADLAKLNGSNVDYTLGIFANGNLDQRYNNTPLLKDMVSKAIAVLNRSQGFLMVVNAVVEEPHNERLTQFQTLFNLNEAVAKTLDLMKNDLEHTLIVVLFENTIGDNFRSNSRDESEVELNIQKSSRILKRLPSDTVLFAQGPKAFLLRGLHDETYLAHVIRYALNIGPLY